MRTQKGASIVVVCVLAVAMAGCGKKEGQGQAPETVEATKTQAAGAAPTVTPQTPSTAAASAAPSAPDYAKMAEQNRQTLVQMNQGKAIEAVPGATLKSLLPSELPGMKRTEASSEKTNAMGVDMSTAEGRYEAADGGDASGHIRLTDVGNMTGPMRMGMAAWAVAQYSRETDTGYEKTTTFNGYKAVEEYNTEGKHGSLRVLVADRFIVEAEGNGVTMDAIKEMLSKVDLKKLAATGS